MTDSTTTSIGGFTVGDHVRLRDDAEPRAGGRIHGVRFADGVLDQAGIRGYADETAAPDSQPEPASDVPHGLAGLRKLAKDIYGRNSLWCAIRSENDDEWGVSDDNHGSLAGTLSRLADEIGAEQAAGRGGISMPEGCSWPTYADGTPVSIGDRYVNISGDVRTVECVTVAIGASALCSHDLDDDVYEPGEHVSRYGTVDTWDNLREDAVMDTRAYCEARGVAADDADGDWRWRYAMNRDLIERAERLARGGE